MDIMNKLRYIDAMLYMAGVCQDYQCDPSYCSAIFECSLKVFQFTLVYALLLVALVLFWPPRSDEVLTSVCLERGGNDLHIVQLMPLPPHHLLHTHTHTAVLRLCGICPGQPG